MRINGQEGFPAAMARKLYKTGQTRGADDDQIYQNRVLRKNTVLIPIRCWDGGSIVHPGGFENGFIVLASPEEYWEMEAGAGLPDGLELGENLLIFYETRAQWDAFDPRERGWTFATSRRAPLAGQYVARVPSTTRDEDTVIREGFSGSGSGGKGAGIRVYEYASAKTIENVRLQLAYLAWRSDGMEEMCLEQVGDDPGVHRAAVDTACAERGLDGVARLEEIRVMRDGVPVCPLCAQPIKAWELTSRLEQAEGREVQDLTVTAANMFHYRGLMVGEYNHRPYNVGWGHHHCNVVARDLGIEETLEWMREVVERNELL